MSTWLARSSGNGDGARQSRHVFVKVCGLAAEDAVLAAADAGVDAAGFVFAQSVRRVSVQHAIALSALLPREVLRVAVLRRPNRREIDEVCELFAPDVLQADAAWLHGIELPSGVRALPVVRDGEAVDDAAGWVLYEGRDSGTGRLANWDAAAAVARRRQLILAGGLDAGNVAEALRRVRPYGVDVSSGVEKARGVKSARRICEFVATVRAAESAWEDA